MAILFREHKGLTGNRENVFEIAKYLISNDKKAARKAAFLNVFIALLLLNCYNHIKKY